LTKTEFMRSILLVFASILVFAGCKQSKNKAEEPHILSSQGNDAVAPYFTQDQQGLPVLCWTEKNSSDALNILKFAYLNSDLQTFGDKHEVSASSGMSTTAESMAKLAFKADGTIVALYGRRFPKEKNPFAGAIYYSISKDKGKSWSAEHFLHSDTLHAYGRSFFDVSPLKNGELAAVWLDGRFGKSIKGSALYLARTTPNSGFGTDTCLFKGTCECCRTDLLLDKDGKLHLAYRNIQYPMEMMGKQVRDMVYQVSADDGRTFSKPMAVSKDNWAIEGCPHSGPTLASNQNGLNAIWFTAAGAPGLYSATKRIQGGGFSKRNLITANGRHPQMLALPTGELAMICEEPIEPKAEAPMDMSGSHSGMKMSHGPAVAAKIVLRIIKQGGTARMIEISTGDFADNHAVVTWVSGGLLIAWIREAHGHSSICYRKINLREMT
jgi:hypothetical protein